MKAHQEIPKRTSEAQKVLDGYNKDVERWRERNGHYKDIQPMSMNDILLLMAQLHPTNRAESKKLTAELIIFICDREIVTAQEIYDELGLSDKPVLKRLKLFQQHGLIRRESKRYYLASPRIHEIRKRYLRRICS